MAIVLLTERSDLEVIRPSNQPPSSPHIQHIDLLVRILQPSVERSSLFGVELKAIRELPGNVANRLEEESNQPIRIHLPIRREDYEDCVHFARKEARQATFDYIRARAPSG
jgi:hypothetical protein